MSKIIKFVPDYDNPEESHWGEVPKPAKNFIPDWYKKQSYLIPPLDNPLDNLSFKACVPFLDSLTSGYMMYTSQEIAVVQKDHGPIFHWRTSPEPIMFREALHNLPVPAGHSKKHFAWKVPFGFLLPKGYSALITQPLNRFDLPFTCVSGIVDEGVPWTGKFSFFLKEGFEGIIPKETPFAQIIPFKTENWKSETLEDFSQQAKEISHKKQTYISGYYKKFIHNKKKFE